MNVRLRPPLPKHTLPHLLVALLLLASRTVTAAEPGALIAPPPPLELPARLTLDEALRLLRERGLDLLIADAQVLVAEGDALSAALVRNPSLSFAIGPTFNYSAAPPCAGCEELSVQFSIGDNGSIADAISGKRALRIKVAREALAAARLGRVDAERLLATQVKRAYGQVVLARATLAFNLELQAKVTETLALNERRYPGVIDEGALARFQIQKLEADNAVAATRQAMRQAQVALAFLLGARDQVPDYDVDGEELAFRLPPRLAAADEESLLRRAFEVRPDLQGFRHRRERALEALRLARRERLPDIFVGVSYSQVGSGAAAASPSALVPTLATTLPLFYQRQGEILHAQGAVAVQRLLETKAISQIVAELDSGWTAFQSSRRLVGRMNESLLARARVGRDITAMQYRAGAIPLTDFLDAGRAYIATNLEYLQDLANYWAAVAQLEQAVGEELRR